MKKFLFFLCCGLLWGNEAWGQMFPDSAWVQGHLLGQYTAWFLFDGSRYDLEAEGIVLTGSFRGWSQDLDDPAWELQPLGDNRWALPIASADFPPRAEFKFRTAAGQWLAPPANTPNAQGGNLVFLPHMIAPTLKAELQHERAIWAYLQGVDRPLDPQQWVLTDATGKRIPLAEVLPNTLEKNLLVPAQPLDIRRVYYLELPQAGLKTLCSFDGWFRELYSDKPLGANVSAGGSETAFRLFAPRADLIKLYLYRGKDDTEAYQTLDLTRDSMGVWEAILPENLKGVWYDFTVHGPLDPGNHFYESNPVHISDPYARVSDDTWGKCRVWPASEPATPLKNGIPPLEDVIAYEVHVQDFTDLLPVSEDRKGTLPAFYQRGLKNQQGEPIGFDYLVDLGINTLHLMPVQEFLHYKDEDWRPAFKDDPFMIEQGIAEENYQWGYRTSHCFAVESRFRQRGTEPGAEREQFRDLVQAFHDEDIAVIIDLVPNHTAENMDAEPYFFHWNVLDKQYYYRTKDLEHIGEYGNEVKTENRPMVQRWLIDQCKHWIEEFGIDGFRIDLAGQIDQQTLLKLREALGPDIIIYGEPWIASADPAYEANPDWDWYKEDSPICYFNDDARNAFKGPVGNPEVKERDRGYAGANFHEKEPVKAGLTATFPTEKSPLSSIAYLDIHDNWALADQFATENWDGRKGVDETRYQIAALLLYTSLGPIVTHGGTEMMRSKGLAELKETVKVMENGGKVYLHGKRDTYNMRAANRFVWENVGKTAKSKGSACDYQGMHAFWRGLNRFRLSETGQIFRRATGAPLGYYQWIDTVNPYQLGYIVDDRVLVLTNVGSLPHDWEGIILPAGNWKLIGSPEGFDHVNGIRDKKQKAWQRLEGGKPYAFTLDGPGFRVWMRE